MLCSYTVLHWSMAIQLSNRSWMTRHYWLILLLITEFRFTFLLKIFFKRANCLGNQTSSCWCPKSIEVAPFFIWEDELKTKGVFESFDEHHWRLSGAGFWYDGSLNVCVESKKFILLAFSATIVAFLLCREQFLINYYLLCHQNVSN